MTPTTQAHNFTTEFSAQPAHIVSEEEVSTEHPPASSDVLDYQRIWNGLLAGFIVLVNTLTFIVILKTKALKVKTKMLIGCLTFTDLMYGVMSLFPRLLTWQPSSLDPVCRVWISGLFLSIYGTAFTVTLIALDRTVAVTSPNFYRVKVTPLKMAFVVASMWILSAVMLVPTLQDAFPPNTPCKNRIVMVHTRGLSILSVVLLNISAMLFVIYTYIEVRLRKQLVRVGAWPPRDGITRRVESRTAMMGLLLAVVFLCGYVPMAVYLLWAVHSGVDLKNKEISDSLYIVIICPSMCAILDPIIYFWRIKEWHSAVFRKCRKASENAAPGVTLINVAPFNRSVTSTS